MSGELVEEHSCNEYSLVVIVKLADFGGYFTYLPALEVVLRVENVPVLLLEAPKSRISIERRLEVSLPAFVADLR